MGRMAWAALLIATVPAKAQPAAAPGLETCC